MFGVRSSDTDIAVDDKGKTLYDNELKDTEKYEEPRDPKEIAKEILELEDGIESFLKEFLK